MPAKCGRISLRMGEFPLTEFFESNDTDIAKRLEANEFHLTNAKNNAAKSDKNVNNRLRK